jgi:microcompartment protein CcmK/EutM
MRARETQGDVWCYGNRASLQGYRAKDCATYCAKEEGQTMTARKTAKPKPVMVRVCYSIGAISLDCEVPSDSVGSTIDAYVKIHRSAIKRHPDLLPELSPVTSSMVIHVDEDEECPDECRVKRLGFQVG